VAIAIGAVLFIGLALVMFYALRRPALNQNTVTAASDEGLDLGQVVRVVATVAAFV
jgi:hypothetical protein